MHGWVESMEHHPEFRWARANGWALMTMSEVLDALPENHPGRAFVLQQFKAHVNGLMQYQDGTGFWHQLLDRSDSYLETSATAIYGNRASNGVIMVTTKKGKKGKLTAAYNGYVGFESVSSSLELMDASQLRAYAQKNNFTPNTNDDKGANTNWMKAIQKGSALSHNHNLSFSGGTDKSIYSASLNYLKKDGIILQSSLEQIFL